MKPSFLQASNIFLNMDLPLRQLVECFIVMTITNKSGCFDYDQIPSAQLIILHCSSSDKLTRDSAGDKEGVGWVRMS